MHGAITPLPVPLHGVVLNQAQDVFMAWYLVKHRDKFIFTFTRTTKHVTDKWLDKLPAPALPQDNP